MGVMIDGEWLPDGSLDSGGDSDEFQRSPTEFHNWITADGEPGPTGEGGFPAEPNRYHLYGALNCPWCHRTTLVREVKELQSLVGTSTVYPLRDERGWVFGDEPRFQDDLHGYEAVHQLYSHADPDYTGRVTVPVLWDRQRETIVNNESSEIIRMFNRAFEAQTEETPDLYPSDLADEIDALNERIYETVNNGVYKAGFAGSQEAYERAFDALFETLDDLDDRLASNRYLLGDRITEADWRLFPTLARFDAAYYGAFKCNLRRLVDYDHLWPYARELYQRPGIAETVDFDVYRQGYYSSHDVVPKGPELHFDEPHDRREPLQ